MKEHMKFEDIAYLRLVNQHIENTNLKTPQDVVSYMGAMQTQNFLMSKWAVGIRLQNVTETKIEEAYNKGEILRTHVLRTTWHLVSSNDIYWMLKLTAPRIKSISKARWKELELTELVLKKCNRIIEKALSSGEHLTRDQLKELLEKAKINTAQNRLSHILLRAELDGLICSGANKGKNTTYALFPERVSRSNRLSKEEALAALANRYFTSHGPATLEDFIWWSGLTIKDAKQALESVKSNFLSETIDSVTYWFTDSNFSSRKTKSSAHLLPAFDEFIISYKDRSAALTSEEHSKAISANGMFYPTILVNGKVAGLWKRVIKKDKLIIEANLFNHQNRSTMNLIEKAAAKFCKFWDKKTEITF